MHSPCFETLCQQVKSNVVEISVHDVKQKMGYQNVLSTAGEYRAWMEAKYPIMQN